LSASNLFILGSGGPVPTAQRFGSSYAVQLGDEYLLIDCGPATTYRLARLEVPLTKIDNLFFTHHHFDHDVDYPCFLLSRWDHSIGQENELHVFGPPPTTTITDRLIGEEGAFAFDWQARVNSPLSHRAFQLRGGVLPRKPPSVSVKDIGPGKVTEGKDWQVTACRAEHVQPWLESLAYRLDSDAGSIVFTGDTGPCDAIVEMAKGADLMVAMCGGPQHLQQQDGIDFGQMGTTFAGKLAQDAGVKKLALAHIGPRFVAPGRIETGIIEVSKVFDGEIIYTHEMMKLPLGD
jgi:ribonuclease BN (tRNA processing enzyme)